MKYCVGVKIAGNRAATPIRADIISVKTTMADPADIFKEALNLDVHNRAALAEKLLASLDELSEAEAEVLWAEEAQRRRDEYRAGRAKAVQSEEVAKSVERLLGDARQVPRSRRG
jgi:putative addiction module component (TIGR02574 family)